MEHSSSSSHDSQRFLQRIDRDAGTSFCRRTRSEHVPLILRSHQKHEKNVAINYWLFQRSNGKFMQMIPLLDGEKRLLQQTLQNAIYMVRKHFFERGDYDSISIPKLGTKFVFPSIKRQLPNGNVYRFFIRSNCLCAIWKLCRPFSPTWTLELLIVQIGHVLSFQLARRVTACIRSESRCTAEEFREPRQMTITREWVVR